MNREKYPGETQDAIDELVIELAELGVTPEEFDRIVKGVEEGDEDADEEGSKDD